MQPCEDLPKTGENCSSRQQSGGEGARVRNKRRDISVL